jgi:hypothetical protein
MALASYLTLADNDRIIYAFRNKGAADTRDAAHLFSILAVYGEVASLFWTGA